jgi:hypothetical protein
MSDYINREDAMSLINKSVSCVAPKVGVMDYKHGVITGLNMACDIVEALSSADVAPVRHGQWIHERLPSTSGGSYEVIRCSECQWQFPIHETRYCPNCNARMDGERRSDELQENDGRCQVSCAERT